MKLRRATPLAFVLAALACGAPSVPYDPAAHNPKYVDYAVFDPQPDPTDNSPADIPLPSDLAFQPSAIATQPAAQAEVLKSFAAQGGWPADQDLSLTFDFVRININADTGATTRTAPALDLSSINPSTLQILSLSTSGVSAVAYDPPVAADYVVNGDHGTLTIHKAADSSGLRHWSAATYVAAVRGGNSGIKVTGGGPVNPRPAMFLITQGQDLSRPENQGLIPGNTREEKAAAAAQLEAAAQGVPAALRGAAGRRHPDQRDRQHDRVHRHLARAGPGRPGRGHLGLAERGERAAVPQRLPLQARHAHAARRADLADRPLRPARPRPRHARRLQHHRR